MWAEAVHHDVQLHNHEPTQALPGSKTPHEVAMGEKPDLLQLCEWGTKWLNAGELDPRAEEAHFVGFDEESKGFNGLRNTRSVLKGMYILTKIGL